MRLSEPVSPWNKANCWLHAECEICVRKGSLSSASCLGTFTVSMIIRHQWRPRSSVHLYQVYAAGSMCWLVAVLIFTHGIMSIYTSWIVILVGFTLGSKLQVPSLWCQKQIMKRSNYQQSHSWLEF